MNRVYQGAGEEGSRAAAQHRSHQGNLVGGVVQLGKKNKKKDDWRTVSIDKEIRAAAAGPQAHGHVADTGHHKMAKSKLKKVYPLLTLADKAQLGIDGVKGLQSLRSNITLGPNSALRSDDPGDGFDPNYAHAGGAMTPRSTRLQVADQEFDRGKLSRETGVSGAVKGGGVGGLITAGLAAGGSALYYGASLAAVASAPVALAGLAGLAAGAYFGYRWGSKKEQESTASKNVIVNELVTAEGLHQGGLDTNLGHWRPVVGGKVEKVH